MSNYPQNPYMEQNQDMEDFLKDIDLSPKPKETEFISRNSSIEFLEPIHPQGSNSQGLNRMTSIQ